MSYNGVGSYYTFTPHELLSGPGGAPGMGSYYTIPQPGLGAYYYLEGFGSVSETFSAAGVWQDVQATYPCSASGVWVGSCNAAGARAVKAVQAGLNALGYGPIPVDGNVNSPWQGQWKQFLSQHGLTPGPGFGLSEQGLLLMEDLLKSGKTPGPNKPVDFKKVNGEYIPMDKGGIGTASMGGILVGALIVGAAYLLFKDRKKKRGGRDRSSRMVLTP